MTTLYEELGDGLRIAYREDGASDKLLRCGFFWLGGFKSDMTGGKAEAIADLARATRRPSPRFDYSGHGQSGGLFVDGTISQWLDQAHHMFRRHAPRRAVVIGSSMGGWLAMLLLRRMRLADKASARRVAGLLLIAPAADMTSALMWNEMAAEARQTLLEQGVWMRPSLYGEPYPITARLIADGERNLILKDGLSVDCPVRILQGERDPDVPPAHALKVFEAISGSDVTLTLIKGGDHRLSTPGHLALIREAALGLAERAEGISP